MLILLKIPKY